MNVATTFLAADKPRWIEQRTYGDCKLVATEVNCNYMIRMGLNFFLDGTNEFGRGFSATVFVDDLAKFVDFSREAQPYPSGLDRSNLAAPVLSIFMAVRDFS